MTKLVSGRVGKIPSANVSADRYQFLSLSEAEPDLGLPSQLGQVFTSDLSGNRYWTRLDTANVSESENNLYYTNTRVAANVALMSVGVFYDVNLANVSTGKALVWDDAANGFITVYVNSEVANVADLSRKVISLENQTTANVREASSNLYFTNTRVLDAISLATINPDNVNAKIIITDSITSNIWHGLYTANIVELDNLFYTNSRVLSAVVPLLTTANVVESESNLYFTNVRAVDAISLANINPNNVTVNGNLLVLGATKVDDIIFDVATGNVATIGAISVGQLSVTSNLTVYGSLTTYGANNAVISDNMIYINHGTNTAANPDIGIVWAFNPDGAEPYQHGGMFRDATDGVIKFFQHYIEEPDSNLFLDLDNGTTGFEFANIQATTFIGNVIGVVSSLSNHTTDALAEGSRQYFTNVRVLQVVNPLLTTANVTELTNQYFTNTRVLQAVEPKLTTANVIELDNLYYTDARVLSNVAQMSINVLADVDITGVGVNGVLIWDGTKFVPGSTEVSLRANFANTAGVANVALLADVANTVVSLNNHTTANLAESTNLYFTNTRARMAFTPGKGIAIQENGVIKNTGAPYLYSLNYNGTTYGNVSSTLSNVLVLPGTPTTDRYLLKSLLITNLHNDTVYVSGNILYGTGNTASIANRIPIHEGGATEFMSDVPQILNPSDIVKLQGFNSAGTPTSNLINYIITYETIDNSIDYSGTGITIPTPDVTTQIYHAETTYAIFESIKLVNLTTGSIKVKLHWADANNNPRAYYVYNFPVPENASVEILQTPKRINSTDKLFVSYTGTASTNALSVFLSSRVGGVVTVGPQTTTSPSGNVVSVAFAGTEADGTTFYYTIE